MRESKAVHVKKRDFNQISYKIHATHSKGALKDRTFLKPAEDNRNIGCQFDSKRNNLICTCRNVSTYRRKDMTYFSGSAKQIYTYHGTRSYTDVGVGNVKVLQKKKVKRVYLPETEDRGVGSEDLSAHLSRKNRLRDDGSYYNTKRTSSKCVGGIADYKSGSVISQKLSPIIRTRTVTTSPYKIFLPIRNLEIGSNTVEKDKMTVTTQVDNDLLKTPLNGPDRLDNFRPELGSSRKNAKVCDDNKKIDTIKGRNCIQNKLKSVERAISSDSLIQHVHNLDNSSDDKNSHSSIVHMEDKLDREYRNIFTCKEEDKKPNEGKLKQDLKRSSVLRSRFEALRRGFVKKESTKKNNEIVDKVSSEMSNHSRRDVSVVSDPPSLEGRSYSNTKTYSPIHVNVIPEKPIYKQRIVNNKSHFEKEKDSAQWSMSDYQDSDYQSVKGMFRLWGKKFNLDDDCYKKNYTGVDPFQVIEPEKITEQIKNAPKVKKGNKKGNKKFFFFKKKTKDKPKEQIAPTKSITAGRCELSQGLMIKIGGKSSPLEQNERINISEDILKKNWLAKYLSRKIESRKSVQIRWNNNTYNTSSSTVFELMDAMYKETGVVFQSRSDVTTGESSYFRSKTRRVNFACKETEAWMIPKTYKTKPKQLADKIKCKPNDNIEVRISNQKWFIDKSDALSNNIQLVLHSNNLIRSTKDSSSSEYLRIDIPKGFFINSTSSEEDKNNQSSDEEVYKIVEYETEFDSKKNKKDFDKGDHKITDIEVIVNVKDDVGHETNDQETVIKGPPVHRNVTIQGSDVNVPKRCNVIEVGIITQRDQRDDRKPILKDPVILTDEESDMEIRHTSKKCKFAESFLQEYYRNWTPLGTDLSSWCVSDSNLKCCSENSESSFHNQGDRTKSCPNIYDDFQASAVITSNDPCGSCIPCSRIITSDDDKSDNTFTSKLFKRFKTKTKFCPHECCKRVLPKDSLEVFKRRKIYAASNKSKWASPSYGDVIPYSVPSIEDKEAQNTMIDCPKIKRSRCGPPVVKPSKGISKKHVSMPDYETMNQTLTHQLANDLPEGILSFKGTAGCEKCKSLEKKCPKHAIVYKDSVCKIPDPLCKKDCLKNKKAPCSKSSSKSDDNPICISNPKTYKTSSPKQEPTACKPPPLCSPSFSCKSPPVCKTPNSCKTPISCKTSPSCKTPQSCKSPPSYKTAPAYKSPPSCKSPSSCKIPPSCTPTLPSHPSNLSYLTKKCSPVCPPSKKSSLFCKKCHSKQSISPQKNSTPPCCKKLSLTNKPSPICPHFPPCKKTQSIQMSPKQSAEKLSSKITHKKVSPHRPFDCMPSDYSNKKRDESSSHTSVCNTPPCRKPSPPKNETQEEFPWPLKNQGSNHTSVDSLTCRPRKLRSPTKSPSQCKKKCLSPNFSNQSLLPKNKTEKECKPNCANTRKVQERSPYLAPTGCPSVPCYPPVPSKSTNSKPKISGLFLTMKPAPKKTCSKDCLRWKDTKEDSTINLSSNEKITIILKKQTPSTEEIREGMNIKVTDIDGQTLYERRDYIQDHHNRAGSILGDMYKTSNINAVSTPIIIKNVQTSDIQNPKIIKESRSDTSIANLIEIQFKLKVTQGDKATEVNITNTEDNRTKTHINENDVNQSQDVFVVKNTEENFNHGVASKNDLNIRIVIKNYKPNVKMKEKEYNDDFNTKISEKFRTVSTGYSDDCSRENAENVYSIHRATVDLTSSTEKSKTHNRSSEHCASAELTEQEYGNFTVASISTKPSKLENEIKMNSNEDIYHLRNGNENHANSQNLLTDTQNLKPILDTNNQISDVNTSDITSNEVIDKPRGKLEKKRLLSKVFEKANHTKTKNKSRMKQLRDMLKIILTSDSSGPEDLTVTSNELAKDVTYASLKPNYFRDTDSMNNYYKIDSALSLEKKSVHSYQPTEEGNSECSVNSDDTPEIKAQGCMCSMLAERLNLCNAGEGSCCCRGSAKRNEETCCDLRSGDDFSSTKSTTSETVDEETQVSKYTSTENDRSIIKSCKKSSGIKNCPAVLSQYKDITQIDEIVKERKTKTYSNNKDHKIECNVKLNKTATLHISNRDETIIVKTKSRRLSADVKEAVRKNRDEERKKMNHRAIITNDTVLTNIIQQADILQSYETKRAVLEIYTESTVSNNREHYVAKLPKFAQLTENEIRNYERTLSCYKNVCKKNIVMSVQR